MRKHCRVMVTGAGSGVGQGIVKALRISSLPITIIAADISLINAGLYRADEAVIIPRVEQANAIECIVRLLLQHNIDVVMIGSEFDLSFFSINKDEIEFRTGALIIVSSPETVEIANDKWLTTEFLRKNQLPYSEAYLPKTKDDAINTAENWGFPVVLKTRRGTSSRHVHVVYGKNDILQVYDEIPSPMLQRLIDAPSPKLANEYTCSLFRSADHSLIGPFTARRTIRDGTSWQIEVASFPELDKTLLEIGNSIDFIGSLNIQLMMTNQGAITFELNSRFSGTTAVRAYFGFNEPEMALLSYFYEERLPIPVLRSGLAMRYVEEVFVDGVSSSSLCISDKGIVNPWF